MLSAEEAAERFGLKKPEKKVTLKDVENRIRESIDDLLTEQGTQTEDFDVVVEEYVGECKVVTRFKNFKDYIEFQDRYDAVESRPVDTSMLRFTMVD